MADVQFAQGLFIKKPSDKAPDFVKFSISINKTELLSWLAQQPKDNINLQVKEAKSGKWYAAVDNFEPKGGNSAPSDDLPF